MTAPKVLFIGLPSSGKTTIATKLAEVTSSQVLTVDTMVKSILNAHMENNAGPQYSHALNQLRETFYAQNGDREKVDMAFSRHDCEKHSSAFMKYLGEPFWRDVEGTIAALLLEHESDYVFDLGASQIFHPNVKDIVEHHGFLLIYLEADKETIFRNLLTPQSDGQPKWKHISNYQSANDWQALTAEHRRERTPRYEKLAQATINISGLSLSKIINQINNTLEDSIAKAKGFGF